MSMHARTRDFDGVYTDPLPTPRIVQGGAQRFPQFQMKITKTYTEHLEDRVLELEQRTWRLNQQVSQLEQELAAAREESRQPQAAPAPEPSSPSAHVIALRSARRRASDAPPGEYVSLGGGVTFDAEGWKLVGADGTTAHVTPNEGLILRALLSQRGRTMRYAAVYDAVWQGQMPTPSAQHALRVHLARLRNKLEALGQDELLETIPGVGLRLEATS
jgi:hypothetical protein